MPAWLRGYYYGAPLWLLIEWLVWPGIRAEAVVGPRPWAVALFYLVEAAIGWAYWKNKRGADWAAFAENLVYLLFSMRFVFIGPLEIVLQADGPAGGMEAALHQWRRALPGVLLSLVYMSALFYRFLHEKNLFGPRPGAPRV